MYPIQLALIVLSENVSNTIRTSLSDNVNNLVNNAQSSITEYSSNVSDELKDVTDTFNNLVSKSPKLISDVTTNVENLAQDTVDNANKLAKTIVSSAQNLINTPELVEKTQSTFTNVAEQEKL